MKLVKGVVLSLLLSSSAFAANSIELSGAEAQELYSALEKVGAVSDPGMGHIGTSASDLDCAVDKFRPQTNSCIIKLQNANGGMTRKVLKGKKANILIDALTNVGVGGCGMQNCGGYEAKSIVCTSSLDPKASADESNCTVQQ